jgi:peptidoglycan/LPS O-acetylase OafA/YrhL
VLLTWAPSLSRIVHFGVLLACTTAVTIALSTVLYRCVEAPGIHAGRSLTKRLAVRRQDATIFLPSWRTGEATPVAEKKL